VQVEEGTLLEEVVSSQVLVEVERSLVVVESLLELLVVGTSPAEVEILPELAVEVVSSLELAGEVILQVVVVS